MSNYFLSRQVDGNSILIDDTFKCLQKIGTIDCSKATYSGDYHEDSYYIDVPDINVNDAILGYSLDAIDGIGEVALHIRKWNEHKLRLRLFKTAGIDGESNYHDFWTKRNDDVMKKILIYVLAENTNLSSMEHDAGMEIHDASGKVLYSTSAPVLGILKFMNGADYKWDDYKSSGDDLFNFRAETINYGSGGIFIPTGEDRSVDRDVYSGEGIFGVSASNGIATVYKVSIACNSAHRRPGPESKATYYINGCIVGNLV